MTEDLKAGEWTYLCCETYIRGSSKETAGCV